MREAEREEGKASNTMAHERHISVCRTDGGRTRRTDNGNRNRSGGRVEAAGPTRRDENGEAETAADKGTAEPSNPSNITSDIRNGDNDFRIHSHVFFGGLRKSIVWVVRVPLRA